MNVTLTKENIYEILVKLRDEMRMPDNCFGYKRREANGVIKYLQDEGLISGVRIVKGKPHQPPVIICLERANITLKGLQFIEDYEKTVNEPSNIDLPQEFISACSKIADNPASYSSFDEDGLNREVRNFLDSAITRFGYSIADQTQQGISGSKPGELDIRINKNGIPVAIYEGLIHKDKSRLYNHIEKAIGKYNRSGCQSVYVVEFSRNKGFGGFWDTSMENMYGLTMLQNIVEEYTGLLGVKLLKGIFDWDGLQGDFYYIGVNCYAK